MIYTVRAVLEAIKELGLKCVGVETLYTNRINELEKSFEYHGIEVSNIKCLGIVENPEFS